MGKIAEGVPQCRPGERIEVDGGFVEDEEWRMCVFERMMSSSRMSTAVRVCEAT